MFGKVIIYAQCVLASVTEVLPNRTAGVGGDVLHGSRIGSRSRNHYCVAHGIIICQRLDDLRDRGTLLPDGHVNANDVSALLINDGVNGKRRLPGLAVSNDQLTLAPADWNHGVNGL